MLLPVLFLSVWCPEYYLRQSTICSVSFVLQSFPGWKQIHCKQLHGLSPCNKMDGKDCLVPSSDTRSSPLFLRCNNSKLRAYSRWLHLLQTRHFRLLWSTRRMCYCRRISYPDSRFLHKDKRSIPDGMKVSPGIWHPVPDGSIRQGLLSNLPNDECLWTHLWQATMFSCIPIFPSDVIHWRRRANWFA